MNSKHKLLDYGRGISAARCTPAWLGAALVTALLLSSTGCELDLGDAPFKCRSSGTKCPPDYDCVGGYCVRPGSCPPILAKCRDGGVKPKDGQALDKAPDQKKAKCGNGTCEKGETNANCPVDCPNPKCGNGTCDTDESPTTCPTDCPASKCGNGTCDQGETNANCPQDCPAGCTDGDSKCDGDSLKLCTSGAWSSKTCLSICTGAGFGYTSGCGNDPQKNKDVCFCGGSYGEPCKVPAQPCGTGLKCVDFMNGTFCSHTCPNNLQECTGTPAAPAGTKAFCVLQVSGQYYCAFLCKTSSGSWKCPAGLKCDTQDNPPGSGQFVCLPPP